MGYRIRQSSPLVKFLAGLRHLGEMRKAMAILAALVFLIGGMGVANGESASENQEEDVGLEIRFVPRKPERTEIGDGFSRTAAQLKFHQGTQVRLREGEFVSQGNDDLSDLKAVLNDYPDVAAARLFYARSEEELAREKERIERRSGREQGDKNLYFRLTFPETTDAEALLDDLNRLEIVEIAYPEELPSEPPAMHTPDFRPMQGYREAAPDGIHADAAMTVPGGRGQNVQIIDIEYFFVQTHEDLPAITVFPNGDTSGLPASWIDHGTAVLGKLFGVDNGFGVLGLADQADAGFVSEVGGRPNAIDLATANSDAGDVILLEMQQAGANGGCDQSGQTGCVAVEYNQANYDAIVAATDDGIIVVEAAGNGAEDLDGSEYDDVFRDRPDSGAIMVGSGGTPDCVNVPRGRRPSSTFGERVNVQGWGECVVTTGYGSLQGSPNSDDSYTAGFNGTSSASVTVAGAAAIISSVAIENGDADGLSSTEARAILIATGTPQETSGAALAGHIGPLPNLAAALGLEADLSVTKTADPEPVVAGENLTYTVTVTNGGPNVATDVTVIDELPDQVSFVSSQPCELQPSGDLLCSLGDLASGDFADVEIEVNVLHDAVFDNGGPVTITNMATANSTIADPDLTNNTASVETTVAAVADLEIVSVEALDVPTEALIGQDLPITLNTTVRNLGPSWPMDAKVETTATPSAGAGVEPGMSVSPVDALEINTPREVEQPFTIRCEQPGPQQVVFDVEIRPANTEDTDPDLSNNLGQAVADVECIVPIAVNIRPGNSHNQVNVGSNGVIPVAALTTAAGEYGLPLAFDATLIKPDTVHFGRPNLVWTETGGAPVHNGVFHIHDSFETDDKTKDGDLDMIFGFRTLLTGILPGDTEACMKGQYEDGGQLFTFFGCDFVQTKP